MEEISTRTVVGPYWTGYLQGQTAAAAEIARLRAALTVCETALHRQGITDDDLLPLLHAAQQASGAHWTDWTPERLADDGLALNGDGRLIDVS